MNTLQFIDKEHEKNYGLLKRKFPVATVDTEYQSACYISSIPMIFYKFSDKLDDYDSPLDWIINWQMKNHFKDENETEEEYQERIQVEVDYNLTSSMIQLGRLALNLFNGYEYFNLMDCLGSLDDNNVEVLKTAIDVRLGHYKGQ